MKVKGGIIIILSIICTHFMDAVAPLGIGRIVAFLTRPVGGVSVPVEILEHPPEDFDDFKDERQNLPSLPPPPSFPSLPSPPSLPSLPQPPSLPPPPSNPLIPTTTITATKTVIVEQTKQVTRHPVCISVSGVKPPCLPYLENKNRWREDGDANDNYEIWNEDDTPSDPGLYIQPTAVARLLEATPTVAVEPAPIEEKYRREGRYLEFRMPSPVFITSLESSIDMEASGAHSETQHPRLLQNLIGRQETTTLTSTLWVTRVEKVTDYRVTATLEVKNCVPADMKVPYCPQKYNHYKPMMPIWTATTQNSTLPNTRSTTQSTTQSTTPSTTTTKKMKVLPVSLENDQWNGQNNDDFDFIDDHDSPLTDDYQR